jgi:ssDNA-binding Zn-finger/Zn-ribbon topoisomerase 1
LSELEGTCPACGAPIAFKVGSSIVVVCEFCHSVVARGDRKLEDLGKVAELIETGSPLDVGLAGVYQGVRFELTGRAQLAHQAGGVWDEWYAALADGRWGWLAEAQGRFYLTFEQSLPEQALIPPIESLVLGAPVAAIPTSVPLLVAETGEAKAIAAKGEIPYKLVPGEQYYYADLSGPRGEFATLDYSQSPPLVFVGREIALAELGLPPAVRAPEREARRVAAVQLSCPKCGGPLDLRAPDQALRVACPNCGSLLDVSEGRLRFMQALEPGKVAPIIPMGSVGELAGAKLTVIGLLVRSVEFEGVRYYWEEYLLYNPQVGFRWLVRTDDNWNYVEPVPPGEVAHKPGSGFGGKGDAVYFRGERFKIYQDAIARVEYVVGEFYWKVMAGELTQTADYVHPPRMLSVETSIEQAREDAEAKAGNRPKKGKRDVPTGEINWSLGTFMKPSEVESAFGISGLPRPSKIAPNQLFPHKKIYKYWLLLLAVAFVVGIAIIATGSYRKVFEASYQLEALKSADDSQIRFSEPFELKSRQNVVISASSNVDNTWLEIEGDLIDQATNEAQGFSLSVEYYHGVDEGESWSEGSQSPSVYLSALPAGTYVLGLEVRWERWQQPAVLNIKVEQGAPRVLHLFLAMVALSIFPLFVLLRHWGFERRRWADSDYSPFGS